MSAVEIIQQVKALPASERLAVAEAIWDELDEGSFVETPAFRAELQSRLDDAKQNPDDSFSWEEVRAEARRIAGK